MLCERCGAQNPPEANACHNCGSPMPPRSECGGFGDILSYENAPQTQSGGYPAPTCYDSNDPGYPPAAAPVFRPGAAGILSGNKTLLGAAAAICAVLLLSLIVALISNSCSLSAMNDSLTELQTQLEEARSELEQNRGDLDELQERMNKLVSDSDVTDGQPDEESEDPADNVEKPVENKQPPVSGSDGKSADTATKAEN